MTEPYHFAVTDATMERIREALDVSSGRPVSFTALDVTLQAYGVPTVIRCSLTLVASSGLLRSADVPDDLDFKTFDTVHTRTGFDVARLYDGEDSLVAVLADGLDPDMVGEAEEGGQ